MTSNNNIYSNKETKLQNSNFNYTHNFIYNKTKNFSNKDLVESRKSPDKKQYQEKRMKYSSTSRYFSNYYDPKLHVKPFIGGKSKEKLRYTYSKSGLSHYNIEEDNKKITRTEPNKEGKTKYFPEFDLLNKKEIVITIEYCAYCEDHASHTQHINDIYLKYSKFIIFL